MIPVIFVGCGPIRLFAESEDIKLLTLKVLDEEGNIVDAVSEVQVTRTGIDCCELGRRHCDPASAI